MTTAEPTPPPSAAAPYWRVQPRESEDVLIPALRARLVAVVGALVIQATIALLGVLPVLPGRDATSFWGKFGVLEFIAAVIISGGFGPRVTLRTVPPIGRIMLAIGFLVVPAIAVALGGLDAARVAHIDGTAATISSWLGTAFFTTIFFGLPLIALAAPTRRPVGGTA